jgi:hypothetical protein
VKNLLTILVLAASALMLGGCGDETVDPAGYCGDGVVGPDEECDGSADCTLLCTLDTGPAARSVSRDLLCVLGPATVDSTTGLPVTDPMGQTEGGTILGSLPVTLTVDPDAELTMGTAVDLSVAFESLIPRAMSEGFIVPAYRAEPDRDPRTDPLVLGDVSATVSVNGTPMTIPVERLTTDTDGDGVPDDGTELLFAIDDPADPDTPMAVEVPIGPFVGTASVTANDATVDFLIEAIRLDLAAVPAIGALSMSSRLDPAMPNADVVVDCLFLDQYPVGSATPDYVSFDAM